MAKHKMLLVDDEVENLNLLRRTFIRDYTVYTAENARDALTILGEKPDISIIISDQRMAGMTGTDFFKIVAQQNENIMKLLLTAYTDVEALVDAINDAKVYKYITKPWDPEDLKLTVRRAIEVYELEQENYQLLKDLAQKNIELKKMKDYTDERIEEERLRISRELHDDICQSLASFNLNMEICMRMLKAELSQDQVDAIKENMINMREQMKETSQQVRRISMDLRPAELDSLGFISTVEQLITRYNNQPDVAYAEMKVIGNIVTLPQKLELAMFRLIQECLNNTKKHANASNINITLNFFDEQLEIIIQDNGVGFEKPTNLSDLLQDGHLGLVGMQERVNQFNGQFDINSKPGEGTIVKVLVKSIGGMFE
ncbi:MAG: response regulator [Cyanobacteriota bacterium]